MNFVDMTNEQILHIVEPVMDNCLTGSNEGNHSKHVKDFTERMKNIVTPENLKIQLSREPRLKFTRRNFIHLFRRQESIGIIWKQYISTSSDELMNQAIFIEMQGRILIDHCMICWPILQTGGQLGGVQHCQPLYCHPLNQIQTRLFHCFSGITGSGIWRERTKLHFMSMIKEWGRDLFRRGCLFLVGGVTPTASLTPLVQVGTARKERAAITCM